MLLLAIVGVARDIWVAVQKIFFPALYIGGGDTEANGELYPALKGRGFYPG
jgi:hypothetical protein